MEFHWKKLDFRVHFTPLSGECDCVHVKAISISGAIGAALNAHSEFYGAECSGVSVMTSDSWELIPYLNDVVFQISDSESQPLQCLSNAMPYVRSILRGDRGAMMDFTSSTIDRFFRTEIKPAENSKDVLIVCLESEPRDQRFATIERKILATEKFESDRLKVFDNYSGKIWDSTAEELQNRVDREVKAIFDRLLEQQVSVNDAFTMISLAVFDARLEAVLDRQFPEDPKNG
jgi:hypothetical protein